ncbi:flagellar assembly protein FliW [Bacillus sp. JJ722]|uniref:flagellar assembly protein FliW n=1 Tax=Bacillus sp. JJ722 TaxID=3122973 RepID=UPI002FFEEF37
MEISTKYHDLIEVDEQDLWYFPNGVPGFVEEKKFVLYPLANNEVFSILQSVSHREVAFIVTNPFVFFQDYDFTLDDNVISLLELENRNDVLPLVILTLGDSLETSTANLQAPIILNMKNHQGKQVILHESPYRTKHILSSKVAQG